MCIWERSVSRGTTAASALKHYEQGRQSHRAEKRPWVMHDAQCQLTQHDPAGAAVLQLLPHERRRPSFQGGLLLGRAGSYAEAAELFGSSRKGYSDPYLAGYNQLADAYQAPQATPGDPGFQRARSPGTGAGGRSTTWYPEAYVKTGRLQEAYDVLRTATRLEPTAEDNYVDLGMALPAIRKLAIWGWKFSMSAFTMCPIPIACMCNAASCW